MKIYWSLTLIIIFTASSQYSYAFRCGNKLVLKGDQQYKVQAICGEPDSSQVATVLYKKTNNSEARVALIESWFYDYGPNRLLQKIVFENGTVIDIESLGYGFRR